MDKFVHKFMSPVLNAVKHSLGYDRLGASFGRFLLVIVAYTLGTTLAGAYFNIFVLRATGSDFALMRYNLLLACVQPVVMLVAVVVLRKISAAACLRIGMLLHCAGYAVLAFNMSGGSMLVYGLSTLFSSGNAFYFTSYTPYLMDTTDDSNRDVSQGAMNMISIALSLVVPLITGFFLTSVGDIEAYRLVFILSALTFAGGFAFTFRLKPMKLKNDRRIYLLDTAKRMLTNRNMLEAMVINMLNSFRVASGYYVSLLMYSILKQEAVIGVIGTVASILGIAASMLYGRIMTPSGRGISIFGGTVVTLLGIFTLILWPNMFGFAVFNIVNTVTAYFIDPPSSMAYMSALQYDPVLSKRPAEVHALREFWWTAGRAGGLLPVFFLSNVGDHAVLMIVLITLLQLPAAFMTHRLQKRIAAEKTV